MGPLISGKSRLVKYYSIWPELLGGGNSNIFWNFHPEAWGRFSPILTLTCAYFSNGLKQPPTRLDGTSIWWGESFPMQMGVSKNRGTPKWMVYNGKPY